MAAMEDIREETPTSSPLNSNLPNQIHGQTTTKLKRIIQLYSYWHGAKPLPLLGCISIGLVLRFAIPKPSKLTPQAWQLLSIFLTTIAGLILNPLPVGAWSFICLTITILTKTLPFPAAFGALTGEVIWLIVVSFFFARGFVKTGLGDRIATYFVKWLGKTTLGLSYGLVICEAMVAPAIPSTTARAGGVFCPIMLSLASSVGSLPRDKSAKRIGAYLFENQFQSSSGGSSTCWVPQQKEQSHKTRASTRVVNQGCEPRASAKGRQPQSSTKGHLPRGVSQKASSKGDNQKTNVWDQLTETTWWPRTREKT